jgi:hypothetical protein
LTIAPAAKDNPKIVNNPNVKWWDIALPVPYDRNLHLNSIYLLVFYWFL